MLLNGGVSRRQQNNAINPLCLSSLSKNNDYKGVGVGIGSIEGAFCFDCSFSQALFQCGSTKYGLEQSGHTFREKSLHWPPIKF